MPVTSSKMGQLGGILLFASMVFLALSVGSYALGDPTWNHYVSSGGEVVQNFGGMLGASLADWGLQLFGSTILLFAGLGAVVAYFLTRSRLTTAVALVWRGLLVLMAVSTVAHLALTKTPFFDSLAFPGGISGKWFADILVPYFNQVGTYSVMAAVAVFALCAGNVRWTWRRVQRERPIDHETGRDEESLQPDLPVDKEMPLADLPALQAHMPQAATVQAVILPSAVVAASLSKPSNAAPVEPVEPVKIAPASPVVPFVVPVPAALQVQTEQGEVVPIPRAVTAAFLEDDASVLAPSAPPTTLAMASGTELPVAPVPAPRPEAMAAPKAYGTPPHIPQAIPETMPGLEEQAALLPTWHKAPMVQPEDDAPVAAPPPDLDEAYDEKYDEAIALVAKMGQASISMLQRRLRVGYNRSARMIEMMEKKGIVGPADGVKPREVFIRNTFDDA